MKSPRLVCRLVALLGVGVGVLAAPALAGGWPELVGRWPYGPAQAVAVAGDFVYFGSGSALVIVDVSNPSAPRVVGEVALAGVVEGVTVAGSYAYVAAHDAGLRVIDVSTPSAPVEVGSIDTPGWACSVAVSGDYAYVVDSYLEALMVDFGLRVVDVSIPSAPVEVSFVDTPGQDLDVAVSNGYAFVANDDQGLRVIDVRIPSAPVEVGLLQLTGRAWGVAVSGEYAYVVLWGAGLRVVDVSTPSAPASVGYAHLNAREIAVSGNYAYAVGADGLYVIDVSTPADPLEVAHLDTPSWGAYDVAVAGGRAFVADSTEGLRLIDVSTPAAPVELSFIDTPGSAMGVAASGGYAYLADVYEGLHVIDVRTPSSPREVGFLRIPAGPIGVAATGGYAYVAIRDAGLLIIDVRAPSAPVEVGAIDTMEWARGVAVTGGYAYVADAGSGLRVIDVSTPSQPVEVAFVDTPGGVWGVAVSGRYAYVTDDGSLLRVIDVGTPSAPVEVGSVEGDGPANSVTVAGSHAYLFGWGGLQVVDVSTPSVPFETGFIGLPPNYTQGAGDVAVSGGFACVADGDSGIRIIAVSTPSEPVEVNFIDTAGDAYQVEATEGYIFASLEDAGLSIFRDWVGSFIPAAAVAAGAEGAFFSTDLEINNTGTEEAQVSLQWLPRGEDNSEPVISDPVALAAGHSLRYENVLTELFGLGPDSLGALKLVASTESVIGMSRTYNIPAGESAGTFGQGLPAVRATEMIMGTDRRRIIFLSEDDDSRANVGCVNGSSEPVRINVGVFDAEGTFLETKTMDLAPWSNNQINRVFRDYQPVNGYVDVWADSDDALYYCYGSMLDNLTSDPTTVLPQVLSDDFTFIPAAALAAGLEGAFFQTDVDLNNVGSTDLTYQLLWLPRGEDNSEPTRSEPFSLAPGAGVRYANVLDEVFGLDPDQVGALALEASGVDLLAISRTYNLPSAKVAGTFGQELPGIPADKMISTGVTKRIIFMSENEDVRSNVGCQNGSPETVRVFIELFNSAGESLETKTMDLQPWSNNQITRVFRNYSPVEAGYVDVWTTTPGASIYCYGSVLDNVTSDPTTVLPQ